jgi:hypothetical protein
MSNRKLVVLGIIAIVMVLWAGAQLRLSTERASAPTGPSYLIQGLDTAEIFSIVLGTGDDQVILTRQGNRFVVESKDDYPAKINEINGVLAACLDIKTIELVTGNATNHADLRVTEERARHVVKLFGKDAEPITGVLISPPDAVKKDAYVRRISSNDVYLTLESQWPSGFSNMDFIDKVLTTVDREKITSVTVTSPDGSYTLKKQADSSVINLENMPTGKKLKGSDYEQVFYLPTSLQFSDVRKEISGDSELNFDRTYICRLEDSTVYTFAVAKQEDKTYVKCDAIYTDQTLVTKERAVESEDELKKKEAKLLARDSARKFSTRHSGWIYQIPQYKADNMTKKLDDLLEDIEENKKDTEESDDDENA